MLYVTYNDVKMNYLVWDSDDYSVEMVSDEDIKYAVSKGVVFENVIVESRGSVTYFCLEKSKLLDKEFYVKSQDLHLYLGRKHFLAHRGNQGIVLSLDEFDTIDYRFYTRDKNLSIMIESEDEQRVLVRIGLFNEYTMGSNQVEVTHARLHYGVSWGSLLSKYLFK